MGRYNERKLSLIYDKRQKGFVVKYPRRCDGALLMHNLINEQLMWDREKAFNREPMCFVAKSLKNELEKRGYDITTLKFSIELK